MRHFHTVLKIMLPLAFVVSTAPAWPATVERHTGLLVASNGQQITIEEMGPWHGPETRAATRVFRFTASTKVEMEERTPQGSQGWRWSYVGRPVELSDLRPGDFVTVIVDRQATRNEAISVQTVRPGPNALD